MTAATITQKSVALDGGVSISYLEAGAGPTLVYLHGAGGRPPSGATFVGDLAAHFRVLLPSRPGFDESTLGDCKSLVDVANAMASFIQKTADGPVHVVAQSAGGAVGLWLALLHPELVSSLVLSAPAAFAHRPAGGQGGPRDLEKMLYGDNPSWTEPPSAEEQGRIRKNAAFNMQQYSSPDSNQELLERLAEIKAPLLVLWGTEDQMVPPEGSGIYQKHLPHALRVFLHGAAHELPIAATQRWVGLIKDFVERGEFFVVNRRQPAER